MRNKYYLLLLLTLIIVNGCSNESLTKQMDNDGKISCEKIDQAAISSGRVNIYFDNDIPKNRIIEIIQKEGYEPKIGVVCINDECNSELDYYKNNEGIFTIDLEEEKLSDITNSLSEYKEIVEIVPRYVLPEGDFSIEVNEGLGVTKGYIIIEVPQNINKKKDVDKYACNFGYPIVYYSQGFSYIPIPWFIIKVPEGKEEEIFSELRPLIS